VIFFRGDNSLGHPDCHFFRLSYLPFSDVLLTSNFRSSLDVGGVFSECSALVVVMSVALCCAGNFLLVCTRFPYLF
jgi:hypothetical protein